MCISCWSYKPSSWLAFSSHACPGPSQYLLLPPQNQRASHSAHTERRRSPQYFLQHELGCFAEGNSFSTLCPPWLPKEADLRSSGLGFPLSTVIFKHLSGILKFKKKRTASLLPSFGKLIPNCQKTKQSTDRHNPGNTRMTSWLLELAICPEDLSCSLPQGGMSVFLL